jgi:hypothetical protein
LRSFLSASFSRLSFSFFNLFLSDLFDHS